MLPGIGRIKALLAQIFVVFRTRPPRGMQAVVTLIGLKPAFGDVHADHRFRRDAERLHAFEIGRHVGLADQHVAHAELLEVIAEGGFADPQRPAVPVRAVRAHVAPGVERHPRGTADRRLHIGLAEQYAALRHGVDVRRLQRGMAGAAEIVVAKLVAHDPENVLRARHESSLPFLDCWMLRYRNAGDNLSQRRPGEGRDPYSSAEVVAQDGNDESSPNRVRWLWVPAFAGTTEKVQTDQGSASAALFAFADTGLSPITSANARSASCTPSPVTAESSSGVFLAARFSRSFCFFNSSGSTASILFSATISILSVSCPA